MNELIKHIEHLLIGNECVIIPNMGGFISHYSPSRWIEEESAFLPPMNIIAFNERLNINDGLLAQSYMLTYKISFQEAMNMIAEHVHELKKQLQHSGKIEIPNIGHLTLNIDSHYEFIPNEDGVDSPILFGLTSFTMQKLNELEEMQRPSSSLSFKEEKLASISTVPTEKLETKETVIIRINRRFLQLTVAAVIALLAFFSFSTPVENTFIDQGNYAELFSINKESDFLKKVEETTSIFPRKEKKQTVAIKKVEKKVEKKQTIITPLNTLRYHIVVASLNSASKGKKVLASYQKKGFSSAYIIQRKGKYRIALNGYEKKAEANKALYNYRKKAGLSSAWLCYARINK